MTVLYPLLAANLIWTSPLLWLATGLARFAFLFRQAQIIYAATGIPAWRAHFILAFIIAIGLTEGASADTIAFTALGEQKIPTALPMIAALFTL